MALLKDVGSEKDYPADLQRTSTETFFLQRLALGLIFKYIVLLGREMGTPAGGLPKIRAEDCCETNKTSDTMVV